MKAIRAICIFLAWLWIAIILLISVASFNKLVATDHNNAIAYFIGKLIGFALFLVPSFILFFVAKRMRMKLDKAKQEALINSFENI
jgi:nitrate reductase gamma subunit